MSKQPARPKLTPEQDAKFFEEEQRKSVVDALEYLLRIANFATSEASQKLPEWLATDGMACARLRMHFPGGVPELRERLAAAERGLETVKAIIARIDKTVW